MIAAGVFIFGTGCWMSGAIYGVADETSNRGRYAACQILCSLVTMTGAVIIAFNR